MENDDLILIIFLLIVFVTVFVLFSLAKGIGRFVFERLISNKAKERLTSYYNNCFFKTLFQGAYAGLCLGPWIAILNFIVLTIKDDFSGWYILLEILLIIIFLPMCIIFYTILCSLFGVLFGVISGILMSAFQKIARSRRTIKHFIKIDMVELFSSMFVGAIIGGYSLSKILPDINLLKCGILGASLVLGSNLLRALYNYLAYMITKSIVRYFRYFSPILLFILSTLCILLSCIEGKNLDFALFGHRMVSLGPILFFLCFFGEFSRLKFIRITGLYMAAFIAGEMMEMTTDDLASLTPIYVFSSPIHFHLF